MLAASYWSLLAPAIDASEDYGDFAVVPSLVGFLIGAAFVYFSDLFLPHDTVEILQPKKELKERTKTQVLSNVSNKNIRNRKPKGSDSSESKILENDEDSRIQARRIAMLILAITIHNI